jgi:23S rRNA pseudouridine2605 synthase
VKSSQVSSKQLSKTALKPGKTVRLNRFLADCGLGSRRKVEALITAAQISVNGEICTDLSSQIDPSRDQVCYDGRVLSAEAEKIFIVLNKPTGYVVSQKDEYSRKTVYDLLPEKYASLPYAGRLDKSSEGLLLFCNDGKLIKQLTHPSHKVEKVYRVQVEPKLTRAAIARLRQGVEIEGGRTQSAGVYVKSETEQGMSLKMVITEGRKRQIRYMLEAVGGKVRSLRRVQFGPLLIKDLPLGRWRPLLAPEIRALYKASEMKSKPKPGKTRIVNKDKT